MEKRQYLVPVAQVEVQIVQDRPHHLPVMVQEEAVPEAMLVGVETLRVMLALGVAQARWLQELSQASLVTF
jgi:hypothetical protein